MRIPAEGHRTHLHQTSLLARPPLRFNFIEQYAHVLGVTPKKVRGVEFPFKLFYDTIIEPRTDILRTMKEGGSVVGTSEDGADLHCKLVSAGHFQTPNLEARVTGSDDIGHQSIVRARSSRGIRHMFKVNGLPNEALLQHLSDVLLVQVLPDELIAQARHNGSTGQSILLLKDGASHTFDDNSKWAYMVTCETIEGQRCVVVTKQYVMKEYTGSAGGHVVDIDKIADLARSAQSVFVIRWLENS